MKTLQLGSILADALRERAARDPSRLAFRFLVDGEDEEALVTYGELDRRARQIAACLAERGAKGERALLVHQPGLAYIEGLFGCLYAGAVAVPAYPPRVGQQTEGLGLVAADAQARFALTTPDLQARLLEEKDPRLAALTWITPELASQHDAASYKPHKPDPGTLAVLQYTSGSTRAPRGVMLSQENLATNAALVTEVAAITSEDRALAWLPPYHDMGLIGFIIVPALTGVTTTLLSPTAFLQRPMRWLRAIGRYRSTITGGPDFAFRLCAQRATPAQIETLDLSSLRIAFTGAERIRPDTLERFAAAFAPAGFRREAFMPSYGLAEATLAVAAAAPGQGALVRTVGTRQLAASGAPLAGTEVRIVEPQTRMVQPAGTAGEIWVRSPSIPQGYWNQPELTAHTFKAELGDSSPGAYLRTGDLGFLQEGQLFVEGRLKDLLIFRGVNHYPEDLEATSGKAHPRLRTGAAFSVEANGEEQLVFVHEVDKPRDQLPAQEIASALRKAVAEEHDLPVQEVVLVPPGALPKTSSGKLQRALTREKYLARTFEVVGSSQRSATGDAAPDLVRATASLFASVLGVTEVGPDEDFFALGGHSLLATQLASRVRETLGFDLPLSAVFESPTPRALAARLAQCAPADRSPPPPGERGETLPLSFSQERMWYQHQLEPTGSAYNVAGALHIDGPLDVAAMERSLAAAVARHEALRSNYVSVDGVPRAVVAASKAISFPLADLSSEPDPAAAAAKLVAGFVALPFDLERDLLVRARLYRLGPDRHVMALSLHHVVADGWSLGILLDELLRGYRGQPPTGPAERYFDYAAWQRQHVGGERLVRDLGFWKKALAGAPMLQLPLDRPRPQRRSSKGSFVPLTLSPELMAQLRALARDEGATLSLVMLGALEVLLSRITGQSDVVVGTPVANRNQLASEALVGTLVNTLPLRFQVDADATFAQLLRSLRDTSLAAWAHQDVPFERIVSELQVERSAGQSPLFQVMYDFQNSPMPDRAAGELRLRPMLYSPGASQFDLSLFILDTELGNAAGMAYSTELFEAQTIERFCAHYLRILEAVAARPKTQVSRIPLLSAGERAALVAQPQANEPPPRELIHRLFEAQVRRTPDAPAVIDAQGTLSYKQLDQLANGLARQLREAGAGPGERVAVFLDRSRRVVVALLATLKTGAAYVPLDPRYPADRVAFLVEDCAPKVLITSEPLRGLLAVPAGVQVVSVQTITPAVAPEVAEPAPPPASDSPAYLIYTSGSTGRPKGVEVPHFAVANFLKSMAREPGLTAADRVLSVTSISFDIAALEIFLPLVNGASVQVAPGTVTSDGFRLAQLIESSGATVMQATPSTYRLLLEAGWEGRKGLRIFVGGEALARELADKLLARGSELWNLYGPTETTIWSSVHRVAAGQGAVPIGHPIDHTALYILDANGEPVPRGVAGELFIGGAGVANGYFRRPELTAERFVKDPFGPGRMYRTGDAARLRSDGAVEYLGRLDQQVKIRGHRIEPGEIEQVLRENTSIRDASVIAREDRPGEVRLVAYYLVKAPVDQADLRELCRRRLPEHMVPSAFVELLVFPLTPNGKLDRKALPKPPDDLDGPSAATGRIPPRDELEAQLAAIWKDVLGRETPGVRDSFFRNGGDSLLAVRLFARIQQRLGIELPLALLAEEPTIEHLAASIRELRSESAKVPAYRYLVPLQTRGHRPKLFCVHGAGGNVLNLPEVARALGPEQPFYGLQASGVDGKTDAQINIEEMATAYLAEVRAVQPHGPYFLAGYCGGGIVAYEMARQVRAAGEKVAALILIDLRSPGSTAPRSRLLDWSRKLSKEDIRAIWRRAQDKVYRDWNNLTGAVRVWWHRYLGKQLPFELRDRWLTDTFLRKADAYKVEPYPGKLVVFRAHEDRSNPAPDLGWGRFAQGGVAAYEVPGDHHTLTHDPNVQVLAAQLAACLRAAAVEAG